MAVKPFDPRPALPGSFFDWESDAGAQIPAVLGTTVAIAGPADWGPANKVVQCGSWDEFRQAFGDTLSPLAIAVYGAFKGEGLGGQPGAGTVMAYRMAGSAAASAAVTLRNTAGTPANALTLTARYPGARANSLAITVQPGAASGTTDLLILDGGAVVETYNHTSTDLAGLAAAINEFSSWVTATVVADGVALGTVSGVSLTAGNDGSTLISSDWIAAFAALDSERWSIFAPFDLTDGALVASAEAWIATRNGYGARCMVVFGGAAGETLTTAIARSQTLNDFNSVNVGVGTLHDAALGVQLSTSQLASRVAGAIAGRGEVRDLIYVRFTDLELVTSPPSLSDQTLALNAGLTMFCKDTNVDAPIFIKEGVTSYSSDAASPLDSRGNKTRPLSFYRRIKNVRIQQGIELETSDWATSGNVLGEFEVNDRTRGMVLGYIKTLYAKREAAGIVQPGWTVILDPSVPISDDDDFVQYLHGFHPTRSLRQVLNVARVA